MLGFGGVFMVIVIGYCTIIVCDILLVLVEALSL